MVVCSSITKKGSALKDDGKSLLLAQIYCLAAAAAMERNR